MPSKVHPLDITLTSSITAPIFDAVVLIAHDVRAVEQYGSLKCVANQLYEHAELARDFHSGKPTLLNHSSLPSRRLFFCGTGSTMRDFDDVRRYLEAGKRGMAAALSAGAKSPLLAVVPSERFYQSSLLATLGALHTLHVPYIIRTEEPERAAKVERLGILKLADGDSGALLRSIDALYSSFTMCRDIGETDPQRMAPPKYARFVSEHFDGTSIKVKVEEGVDYLTEQYPLLAAVNRTANRIDEHKARVVWLEYENRAEGATEEDLETVMLVGKGVTLDTGGADVKVGGGMFGMCRDKYGSAVVASFFDALDKLQPKNLKAVGVLCIVRNSIGSDSYTTDEIIKSRSGKRILIANTDAEGRLAMADPLTAMCERAINETNPHLYTVATLTGHEVLSMGYFPAVMDNGPAQQANHARRLQETGDEYGQPIEISRLHIEDFDYNDPPVESVDLRQGGTRPSVQTIRGHQSPAAFLIRVSRLDEHGTDSTTPIKYSHLDIGGSAGDHPATSFPCPLLTLVAHYILPRTQ